MSAPNDPTSFPSSSPIDPQLSADDQRLVDALVDNGFDRNALSAPSAGDSKRLDSICGLMGLMRDYPVEDASDTLVHATLARIDRYEDAKSARLAFDNRQDRSEAARPGWRLRVPDFITVAAVLLIGVSIFWPALSTMRQKAVDAGCENNLRYLGYAFGNYAADHRDALPVAMAGPSLSWDRFKNALNLEPLVSGKYCEAHHLNCPGHHQHGDAVGPSYSYRWFTPGSHMVWGAGRNTVILGDRNPIVDAARGGSFLPPLSISINHGGRGQFVLVSDGATMWLDRPMVDRDDNIWLPNGFERLEQGRNPSDELDVFLTH